MAGIIRPRIAGIILGVATLLLASCSASVAETLPSEKTSLQTISPETIPAPKSMSYSAPPEMTIDTAKSYVATIETTQGDLVLDLYAADVPITVNNFVFLSREGFYDGTTFHRVIADFMVQGGDPTGTGTGGPGYKFADEFTSHGHGTGTLSMANAGPGTNGSQFFITYAPQPHLDGKHSVFGQLTSGTDVLAKIESGDTIVRIVIEEK